MPCQAGQLLCYAKSNMLRNQWARRDKTASAMPVLKALLNGRPAGRLSVWPRAPLPSPCLCLRLPGPLHAKLTSEGGGLAKLLATSLSLHRSMASAATPWQHHGCCSTSWMEGRRLGSACMWAGEEARVSLGGLRVRNQKGICLLPATSAAIARQPPGIVESLG
jgi:hypothetical protein